MVCTGGRACRPLAARLANCCRNFIGSVTVEGANGYNHIFDPTTGRSPQTFSSVTVVAGLDADARSTAIFVLGIEALRLTDESLRAGAFRSQGRMGSLECRFPETGGVTQT